MYWFVLFCFVLPPSVHLLFYWVTAPPFCFDELVPPSLLICGVTNGMTPPLASIFGQEEYIIPLV